ncbi:hypothetical protein BC831DRAFT_464789 [Entophlyctis helioformis]|nr:hypothetical protein BC831DRAFT_464789 [Entophlyctis helioformis]
MPVRVESSATASAAVAVASVAAGEVAARETSTAASYAHADKPPLTIRTAKHTGAAHGQHRKGPRPATILSSLVSAAKIGSALWTVRALLAVLPVLLGRRLSAKGSSTPSTLWQSLLVKLANTDNARLAAIVAAMSATFRVLTVATTPSGSAPSKPSAAWSAAKGALASLWLFCDPSDGRRAQIAIALVVRTFYFALRSWVYEPLRPSIAAETSHANGSDYADGSITKTPTAKPQVAQKQLVSHAGGGHVAVRRRRSRLANSLARYIDKYGTHPVWLINAYYICYYSFNDARVIPAPYFRSTMFFSSNRDRYGSDCVTVTKGLSKIVQFLHDNPPDHPLATIPSSAPDTLTFWRQLVETTKPDDPHHDAIEQLKNIQEVMKPGVKHHYMGCAMVHPSESACEAAAGRIMWLGMLKLTKTYSILNGAFAVFALMQYAVKHLRGKHRHDKAVNGTPSGSSTGPATPTSAHKELLATPKPFGVFLQGIARRFVLSTAKSVVAVSLYLACFCYSICLCRRFLGYERKSSYGIAGMLASPAMLLEKQSRMPELNTYLTTQTVESVWMLGVVHGWWSYIKYGEMLAAVPAMSILTSLLETQSHAIHGFYEPLLHGFFGTRRYTPPASAITAPASPH